MLFFTIQTKRKTEDKRRKKTNKRVILNWTHISLLIFLKCRPQNTLKVSLRKIKRSYVKFNPIWTGLLRGSSGPDRG